MGFNKGEWSELYAFLTLLVEPNLSIVDENLTLMHQNIFQVVEIRRADHTKYRVANDKNITKISPKNNQIIYLAKDIKKQKNILLDKIVMHTKSKGSFEIEELQALIDDLLDGQKFKGSSRVKGDLEVVVLDKQRASHFDLNYNIKSNLGSPPTLLNASNHTNFIYEIDNIDDTIMQQSNAIKSRKKLLERCAFLTQKGARFSFSHIQSDTFAHNLKLIDSDLDKILANMLLLSYQKNQKGIEELIALSVQNKNEHLFYKKKIGDFANAITFGMRASELWNGDNEVNGGIILVSNSGKVYLLDLIYYKSVVDRYLIDNIKLDSPSSKRYKMFEIYKEGGRYYFKLNLQIRFK